MFAKLCLSFIVLLGGVINMDVRTDYQSIPEIYHDAVQIVYYDDGVATAYGRDDATFAKIITALAEISQGSHDMPAFGVSLDAETRQARLSGVWLELVFDGEKYFNDYNFTSLLFQVKPDDSGFNLIRKIDGKYEGRCLYLALDGNMQALFDTLKS